MDKWDPKEEIYEHPYIQVVLILCITCITLMLYIISNTYTLDTIKDTWRTWINRVLLNAHISNGTFYTIAP